MLFVFTQRQGNRYYCKICFS